ncbi:uncharacterized protein C11orf16 homolog [Pteronotus mesoamericanus]|uniref:uncharacterized protein C11orf16 homolog n=1 Tax=Pteronotus mesoamericanus TaxID=1884717 RepID=UPI0023EC46F0|nr:uncharacterized protein C11orf16 homolog [Pteronotus parnellii mesoamericanus]
MESSVEPGMPLPKYCSVATTLEVPAWAGTAPPWDLAFTGPFALQAPWLTWHHPLPRCASYQPYLHVADPAWRGPRWLGRVGDAANTWVLAKREPDGFYYRAQRKPAPELERQGVLLVEFEDPLVTGPELPAQQPSVVLGEDVIQFLPSTEYLLQPGDKVLAPWEPDRQRYGPATVLGLEARDPQRASKEEITVHFWNGKTATVPLGGVRWVPPAVWKKAVERLHRPLTREHPSALLGAPRCSLLGPGTGCITYGLPQGPPYLCPHSQLLCQGCLGCPLAGPAWWPLARTLGVTAREHPEAERKPTAQLLPLEAPKEEEVAVPAPIAVSSSSSSSSSSEEDLEKGPEMGPPQRLMVDSTVDTDPVPLKKTPRRPGSLCQPEGRYWRRDGPAPRPGKPGLGKRCCNVQTEVKGNKQQREQTVIVGNTKELVLEATSGKPPQILPEKAESRKPGQGAAATRQRGQSSSD